MLLILCIYREGWGLSSGIAEMVMEVSGDQKKWLCVKHYQ